MKLTKPQAEAVSCDGNALVVACPGSGKTRTLIAKLIRCLDDVRDSPRRIACITYTNAAVYEIEHRLRLHGSTGDEDYCEIATIHSFCLHNILRYFGWRLPDYAAGFRVASPDSDEYQTIVRDVCQAHGLNARAHDAFELLSREPDGTSVVAPPLTQEAAADFWERLQAKGMMDFCNILYGSYRLLCDWPSIADALSCRFAWFLVDEFQDTSALQVEILRKIAKSGHSRFFLVGDPFQSIYGFAGARPQLMEEFAGEVGARCDLHLPGNFRSSSPIIRHAEQLCPRRPAMYAAGKAKAYTEEPVYVHVETAFDGIIGHFIPKLDELGIPYGAAAILAPWWTKLLPLGRKLREAGIPVVGPGARPYKRTHLLARLAENMCAFISHPDTALIPRIERELALLLCEITGSMNYQVYTHTGRRTVFRLIHTGEALREHHEGACDWLKNAACEFERILSEDGFLPAHAVGLLPQSAEDMEQDMVRHSVDVANLPLDELGVFASPEKNLKLLTMHGAKGREFDAVALIDLHVGKLPHYSAKTPAAIDEGRRQLYVAMTRARRVLFYVTDQEDARNTACRFLLPGELGVVRLSC